MWTMLRRTVGCDAAWAQETKDGSDQWTGRCMQVFAATESVSV